MQRVGDINRITLAITIVTIAAAFLWIYSGASPETPERWLTPIISVLSISTVATCVLALTEDSSITARAALAVKLMTVIVLIIPTTAYPVAQSLLVLEALYWIGRATPPVYAPISMVAALLVLTAGVLSIPDGALPGVGNARPRGALLLVNGLIFAVALSGHRILLYRIQRLESEIGAREAAIQDLSEANVGFQRYLRKMYAESVQKERQRLARELHDGVMYALTNTRILITNALDLSSPGGTKLTKLLSIAQESVTTCIVETRKALRSMRERPLVSSPGLAMVKRIAEDFASATGVSVAVDFANARLTYGERIDLVIYRFVQEALTNAFRHGHARRVHVAFRDDDAYLTVTVSDDGRGAKDLTIGQGLTGMAERLQEVGGELGVESDIGGFTVRAHIRLSSEAEEERVEPREHY